MARRNGLVLLVILALFAFAVWIVVPLDSDRLGRNGMRLGLDLVGGVYLVYQADFTDNATDHSDQMKTEATIIQKRIDTLGVTEPIIQTLGDDRILIQLPGFTDIDEAKKQVEQVGFLEFRVAELNSSGVVVTLGDYLSDNVTDFFDVNETSPRLFVNNASTGSDFGVFIAFLSKVDGALTFTDKDGNPVDNATLQQYSSVASWIPARGDDGTPLTGNLLTDAQPALGGTLGTTPEVNITWNSEGADIFNQIAARIYDPQGEAGAYSLVHALGIFLDNNLISAPKVNSSSFSGGQATISGNFNRQTAEDLANLLKSGALPVQLKSQPLYQETVSATLGTDSLNKSMLAGIIGIAIVMLFMIAYYRLLGGVATAALFVYGAISLSIFKLIPITLTLPGIAGFIISVGMAVDANILIFERMKEEMRSGRTLEASVAEGFRRAWPSIRDSNFATFITCIILYWFGGTFGAFMVKGFALTLFIGVAVSMFSAIMVTRTFLIALIRTQFKQAVLGSIK
jgi:preprotein translocase subunit SecD